MRVAPVAPFSSHAIAEEGSARPGGKVAGEEGARCFQVVYVEGSVVYLHRASVAGRGQVGVVVVAEHAADLALQIALFGEGRQGVFGKKSASQRVESRPGAAPGEAAEDEKRKDESAATKKAVKKVKEKLEKTTLGDITELAALKDQMLNAEKKATE